MAATALRLEMLVGRQPRVARSSQPWALGHSPVGAGDTERIHSSSPRFDMNESARKRILDTLVEIAKGLKPLQSELELFAHPKSGQNFMHDCVLMSISGESLKIHDELVASLLKQEAWSDKFSEKFLDGQLRSLYARFLLNPSVETLAAGLGELTGYYQNFNTEHLVVIPLAGIVMTIDSLEIGSVSLRRATPAYLQQCILGPIKDLPADLVEKSVQRVLKGRKETVCAECRIVAERKRAEERTFDECNRALDVLRYAIPELNPPHLKTSIGFEYDVLTGDWLRFFTSVVGGDQMPAGGQQNFSFSELKLDANTAGTLERIGALRLSTALKKPMSQLTDFEKVVLRGVRWYSMSQKTMETENKFLNLTTCLETFFTPKERDPIANAIAEGCAFVLGEGFENRKSIHRRVKQLYGQRSGLSHGGKTAILDSELMEIEFIAWHLLYAMIAKLDEIQSKESLREWIEEQKFK